MYQRFDRHESRDDYLEAILLILEKKGHCRSVDVVNQMDVSKPSVSVAMSKLCAEGYLLLDEEKMIHFTEKGRAIAENTLRKHRYFRKLLEKAGVDEETADLEACAIEHAISQESFEKLSALLPEIIPV